MLTALYINSALGSGAESFFPDFTNHALDYLSVRRMQASVNLYELSVHRKFQGPIINNKLGIATELQILDRPFSKNRALSAAHACALSVAKDDLNDSEYKIKFFDPNHENMFSIHSFPKKISCQTLLLKF